MWQHPATQRNLATLTRDGVVVIGPNEGAMAEAEWGPGRLAEPMEIVAAVEGMLAHRIARPPPPPSGRSPSPYGGGDPNHAASSPPPQGEGDHAKHGGGGIAPPRLALAGRRVLITSGPTHEPIDPVRYIANRSSGRQGHAIAVAAAAAGAEVTLISGPVTIPDPSGLRVVRVESAREMLAAVEASLPADIAVFAAAVADWRAADEAGQKLKKDGGEPPPLRLALNPDILRTIAQRKRGRPPLVVGFAAETETVIEHAKAKLARKGCDLIVANDVSPATGIMGGTSNAVHLVTRDRVESWPSLDKEEVARRLVTRFAELVQR
jgi:phosphopantothenoylcysteine decarboxylase/phosphopantothenate--cysteine ligase